MVPQTDYYTEHCYVHCTELEALTVYGENLIPSRIIGTQKKNLVNARLDRVLCICVDTDTFLLPGVIGVSVTMT